MARSAQLIALALYVSGAFAAPTPVADDPSPVEAAAAPPATFTANANIGPGGSVYKDSPHFRVYGNNGSPADQSLAMLEGAYDCFVTRLGWRSTGLSFNDAAGTGSYTKINVYSVASLPGAAGVMHSDYATGMAWLEVQQSYIANPGVVVHEFGHGVHYHQRTWVDQGRTGAWWETFANWFADTYKTSDLCAASRQQYGQPTGATEIDLAKTIGDSFQVLVDGSSGSGNYYQAWPFFAYITANPDRFTGLGTDAMRQLMVQYAAGSNETPLHTLDRVATANTAAQIVGRYWARMAFVDIGHPAAHAVFLQQQASLNYNNVQSSGGSGRYTAIASRRPKYMGANIIRLSASAGSSVGVTITSSGQYTATLVASGSSGIRYVALANGSGTIQVASGESVRLVVANTPSTLILYDPFSLPSSTTQGLDYSFTLTGATVQ